jgi:hypothetical protein
MFYFGQARDRWNGGGGLVVNAVDEPSGSKNAGDFLTS